MSFADEVRSSFNSRPNLKDPNACRNTAKAEVERVKKDLMNQAKKGIFGQKGVLKKKIIEDRMRIVIDKRITQVGYSGYYDGIPSEVDFPNINEYNNFYTEVERLCKQEGINVKRCKNGWDKHSLRYWIEV